MHARLLLVLTTALLGGCAALNPQLITVDGRAAASDVEIAGAKFHLEYAPVDERTASEIVDVLKIAVPRIVRWGTFDAPVNVRIQPSHDALETAVRREGWGWLRAWARYDSIDLQSPRTWSLLGPPKKDVVELLTHELTHCLMYQRAATAFDWPRKEIPLWFREGMASFTAEQGYRRPTDEDLWRYLRANPDKDPITDADALYQSEADIVYGSAHRAFEFLVKIHGEDLVRNVLARMKTGESFPEAFEHEAGVTEPDFEARFVTYVKTEQFRRGKLPIALPPTGAAGDPANVKN